MNGANEFARNYVDRPARGLALARILDHRGALVVGDSLSRALQADVRALADAAAVNASELERDLALRNLRRQAVETELGPAVPLRLVEQYLAAGAS